MPEGSEGLPVMELDKSNNPLSPILNELKDERLWEGVNEIARENYIVMLEMLGEGSNSINVQYLNIVAGKSLDLPVITASGWLDNSQPSGRIESRAIRKIYVAAPPKTRLNTNGQKRKEICIESYLPDENGAMDLEKYLEGIKDVKKLMSERGHGDKLLERREYLNKWMKSENVGMFRMYFQESWYDEMSKSIKYSNNVVMTITKNMRGDLKISKSGGKLAMENIIDNDNVDDSGWGKAMEAMVDLREKR